MCRDMTRLPFRGLCFGTGRVNWTQFNSVIVELQQTCPWLRTRMEPRRSPQTFPSCPARAEVAPALTASALVFLFADTFVGTPPRNLMGIDVPCRASKVDALSLAAVLCATALWSLREQGLVALHTVKRKRAFVFQWHELSVLQLNTDERVYVAPYA